VDYLEYEARRKRSSSRVWNSLNVLTRKLSLHIWVYWNMHTYCANYFIIEDNGLLGCDVVRSGRFVQIENIYYLVDVSEEISATRFRVKQ
jgi:hypothetical protein